MKEAVNDEATVEQNDGETDAENTDELALVKPGLTALVAKLGGLAFVGRGFESAHFFDLLFA